MTQNSSSSENSSPLSLDDYQEGSLETVIYPELGDNIMYPVLGLNGEAGELAEKVKKSIRDESDLKESRDEMIDELGDVLWYVAICAHELGVDLSDVARRNLDKLRDRKERGTLQGSGDKR
ncbi:MAG: nucleoside triphosphate pyrophosphohydrolase family protein [bacterium]